MKLHSSTPRAMPKSSPILIWTVCAAVFVLSICKAPARDLGQWDGVDPLHRQWFKGLMRPDRPLEPCCGLTDAYWADSYEVKAMNMSPLSSIHATTNHSVALTSTMERVLQFPTPRSNGTMAIRPGTALSLSAMVVRSIVICHLGVDRPIKSMWA
jgi:hypothetical protein